MTTDPREQAEQEAAGAAAEAEANNAAPAETAQDAEEGNTEG